ncbi:MAG: hypothetical protein ACI4PK_01450, partial [Oscillospiraceae bacterium]
ADGRTIRSTSGDFNLTGNDGIFQNAEFLRKAFNSNVVDGIEIISGEKIPMDEVAWTTTNTNTTAAASKTTSSKSLFTTSFNSAGESGKSGFRINGESLKRAAGSKKTGTMSAAEAKKVYAWLQK